MLRSIFSLVMLHELEYRTLRLRTYHKSCSLLSIAQAYDVKIAMESYATRTCAAEA